MSYYPPPGSYQSFHPGTPQTVVYPGTPLPASNYLAPQQQVPNVIYVPARSSSRNSHRHGHDHGHGRSHSRERRHNGRSHSHERRHSDHRHSSKHKHGGHRRHASEGHRRHRSHHDYDYAPHGVTVSTPSAIPYYRPTWTQRLRQFFGLAPPVHRHMSDTRSWGLFRPKRQRYVDAYSGTEVDMYGRPVYRV